MHGAEWGSFMLPPCHINTVIFVMTSLLQHSLLYNKLQQTLEKCSVISLSALQISKLMQGEDKEFPQGLAAGLLEIKGRKGNQEQRRN